MPELQDRDNLASKVEKLLALLPRRMRKEAAVMLERGDARSLQLLTDIISSEHTKRRTRAVVIVVPSAMAVAGTLLAAATTGFPLPWYMGVAGISGFFLLLLSMLTGIPTALEKAAVEAVVLSSDKHSIGALLEGLQIHNLPGALQEKNKQALIRILQSLTPEDADLLTPVQRSQLHRSLSYIQRDNNKELRLATLTALQQVGDWTCLGVIYTLLAGEAATDTAQTVRAAARDCIEALRLRLDFGSVTKIPEYTESLIHQMQSEGPDYQISAVCMLALRRLLPLLHSGNYRDVLSERQRDHLYQLLTLPLMFHQHRHGNSEIQEEILRTAHRLGDTRALPSVRKIAFVQAPNPAARQLRTTALETLRLLEEQVVKEKESKTLLRGASAPASQPHELLRAAAPTESMTAANELLRASVVQQERPAIKIELPNEERKAVLLQRTEDHRL